LKWVNMMQQHNTIYKYLYIYTATQSRIKQFIDDNYIYPCSKDLIAKCQEEYDNNEKSIYTKFMKLFIIE